MGLFSKKQSEPALTVVESKPDLPSIRYIAGTGGRGSKSSFMIQGVSIPVSLINKVEKLCQAQPEGKAQYIFHSELAKRHKSALDSIDELGLSYPDAYRMIIECRPVKKPIQSHRGNRIEKFSKMLGKVLCRCWKGSDFEITSAFFETVQREDLKAELSKAIQGFEATYSRNAQGYIRTSARKGRELKGKVLKKK